jgi:hypothetical protein
VPAVFFLVDGGALSQLGDEVCRWRGEHVKPVVGDGAVRPAVRPSELDGFQVVVSVEVGDDERARWAVNGPGRPAPLSPAEDLRGAELPRISTVSCPVAPMRSGPAARGG